MDKSKQQRYRENNPKNVEFSQLKQNVKRQNLKETDPEKADLVREANRKRKAAERARKKATKENIDPVDSESSDVSVNKSIRNCDFSHVTFANEDEELNQNNVSDENEGFKTPKGRHRKTSKDHSSDQSTPGSSRQNLLGIKIRRKKIIKIKIEKLKNL